jgi:hypothetical protein
MLARLINAIYPPGHPSALLVVGNPDSRIYVVHILPEDGHIERFVSKSSSTTMFRDHRFTEQARKQIGTVTLHVGDREGPLKFLQELRTRTPQAVE